MKNLIVFTFCSLLLCSCATRKQSPVLPENRIDAAIEIAITDFLKCRLKRHHNAFSIRMYERGEYDRYEINDDLIAISISPRETTDPQYYFTLADSVGSMRLPTRHMIKGGKLFYWHDSEHVLTSETIAAFKEYNVAADSLSLPDHFSLLGLEVYGDDFQKAAQYYFCKNDLSNYKRVITSTAMGWYEPPRLRCRK